jgi:hypothetical protein
MLLLEGTWPLLRSSSDGRFQLFWEPNVCLLGFVNGCSRLDVAILTKLWFPHCVNRKKGLSLPNRVNDYKGMEVQCKQGQPESLTSSSAT